MTLLLGWVLGYLIGSIPTADPIARRAGVSLRTGGSRNPGTSNALRLGGRRLAAGILAVELAKGITAVAASLAVSDAAAAAAGVGAVVGNVANPWYRLRGGQGLGIGGGVLLAGWPAGFVAALATLAAMTRASRSTRIGALAAMTVLVGAAVIDPPASRWGWGLERHHLPLAAGIAVTVGVKQSLLLARDRRGS